MPDTDNPPLDTRPGRQSAARRRRYARSASAPPLTSLTPPKWEMLGYLAELRFLSLPQLARLCCPSGREDLSERAARRHLRALFDAGMVDALPVSRAALAPPEAGNGASLLYGSAPNVYAPTREGLRALVRSGRSGEDVLKAPLPSYGPRNGLFLAHELLVRDVRVWLEGCARAQGHSVERWEDGEAAAIPLGNGRVVRPDAWFAYRMGKVVLVGLVEADRGTERGDRRWGEKLDAYALLFSGEELREATGYVNARVLVVCPDERRRDGLADLVEREAAPELVGRFWLAERDVLNSVCLRSPVWRHACSAALSPLIRH